MAIEVFSIQYSINMLCLRKRFKYKNTLVEFAQLYYLQRCVRSACRLFSKRLHAPPFQKNEGNVL